MKRNLHKLLSMVLVFAMCIMSVGPLQAYGMTSKQTALNTGKTNFNFISTDNLENVIYTYDKNGESYKVMESTKVLDFESSDIETKIYIKNELGEYCLESEFKTNVKVKTDSILISTLEGNTSSTEVIELDSLIQKEQQVQTIEDSANSWRPVTGWMYTYSYDTSTIILRHTLSVVIAIISGAVSGIVFGGNPALIGAIVGGVTKVSEIIVEELIPDIYFTKHQYLKYREVGGVPFYSDVVAERIVTNCYSDSNRAYFIGSTHFTYE